MAAGPLEPLLAFSKEWGILALVLMSFAMQVILLITAEVRRLKDSGVLKVVVWSAYLLADTTAIYALGHMSVTCTPWQEHQLMAFWAPFLLLHLGGQDNITAYSIEDNQLWLRHLQSFVVQVLAASYILYQSSIVARRTLLRPAAILIFVVGVVKYGERVCALKLACSSNLSGKNYQKFSQDPVDVYGPRALPNRSQTFRAHVLLDIAKHLLKGPLPVVEADLNITYDWEEMYAVAEMQLSLMHDVFYSKAELIHTWYGYCIRVFSLVATVAALVLFGPFSEKEGYRRADVAATYVLLVGAVVLEIISALRAMFSTWTYRKVITGSYSRVAHALARMALIPLRFQSHVVAMYEMCRGRGGMPTRTRYWSGIVGQHDIHRMAGLCESGRGSKIARWMGWEDWWNMMVYTSSVPVSPDFSELLRKQIQKSLGVDEESPDHILNSRGRAALKRRPGLHEELGWSVDTELDETILVWHIATYVYLQHNNCENEGPAAHHLARVTKELSNYMMFLLAARPYMLPDNASRQRYVELCHEMIYRQKYCNLVMDGAIELLNPAIAPQPARHLRDDDRPKRDVTYDRGCWLGNKLFSKEKETTNANMLELISQVWVELLCYTAYRCKSDSHARQLSNGGELTTVVSLLLEYTKNGILSFEPLQDTSVVCIAGSTT